MKNIHVLPTDKPSRLRYFNGKLELMYLIPKKSDIVFQNIYITSDEEIKEVDWAIDLCEDLGLKYQPFKVDKAYLKFANQECKKIILTTDQDLIKDGVQAIDDTFLEWFIKNPSCEEVEFEVETTSIQLPQQQLSEYSIDLALRWINKKVYKIIIPKEETKETLEEAAESLYPINSTGGDMEMLSRHQLNNCSKQEGFIAGAKWQQEQIKNESTADYIDRHIVQAMVETAKQKMFEEVKKLIVDFLFEKGIGREVENVEEWFEQFKKK